MEFQIYLYTLNLIMQGAAQNCQENLLITEIWKISLLWNPWQIPPLRTDFRGN